MHNRSTNTAFHTFVDEILFNMNNRLLTGVCLLDIRKGFDSVNHEILLHKLEKYGVLDVSLSYLIKILHVSDMLMIPLYLPMGVRSLRKGGGDLSREVWHNKGLWYKNNKKYEG